MGLSGTSGGLFAGKDSLYEAGRPSYAPGLLSFLGALYGPRAAAADIGSGTGIFSRQLLSLGWRVFAVEPEADMRRAAVFYGRP